MRNKASVVLIGIGAISGTGIRCAQLLVDRPDAVRTEQSVQSSPYQAWTGETAQFIISSTDFATPNLLFYRLLHGSWPTTAAVETVAGVCKKDALFQILWGSTITPPKGSNQQAPSINRGLSYLLDFSLISTILGVALV